MMLDEEPPRELVCLCCGWRAGMARRPRVEQRRGRGRRPKLKEGPSVRET